MTITYKYGKLKRDFASRFERRFHVRLSISDIERLNENLNDGREELKFWSKENEFSVYKLTFKKITFYALFYIPMGVCFTAWKIGMESRFDEIDSYREYMKKYITKKSKHLVPRRYLHQNVNTKTKLYARSPICGLCGLEIIDFKEATIDHILPRSKHGGNNLSNLQLAHEICNTAKGNANNEVLGRREMRRFYILKTHPEFSEFDVWRFIISSKFRKDSLYIIKLLI